MVSHALTAVHVAIRVTAVRVVTANAVHVVMSQSQRLAVPSVVTAVRLVTAVIRVVNANAVTVATLIRLAKSAVVANAVMTASAAKKLKDAAVVADVAIKK